MINQKSISIFIPIYNEAGNIDNVVSEAIRVLELLSDDYEVLLINDGSTDNSAEKILAWIRKNDKIRVITHEANLGYGSALRCGFENAKNDLILYADADMHVDLNKLREILSLTEECDLLIGYRVSRKFTLRRFFYSKVYNLLLKTLLNIKVKDANCSFKCIKKEAIKKINLSSKSVFIDGELLAEAVRNNLTIKEIPFIYRPRMCGKSNFDSLDAAFVTLKEIIIYWAKHVLIKRKNSRQ